MSGEEVVGIGLDLTPLYAILLNSSGYSAAHPDSPIGQFNHQLSNRFSIQS